MITLNKREKIIAVVCLTFCLGFVGKQLILSRFVDYRDGLEDRLELVARKITQAQGIIHREQDYDLRLNDVEKRIGLVSSEGEEMARMASKVEEVGRQVTVRVVNVQPLSVHKEKFYFIYPLEVVLEGEWKGIARFVNCMQASNGSLNIEQMRLEKSSDAARSLRGRIVLSWIRLRPDAR